MKDQPPPEIPLPAVKGLDLSALKSPNLSLMIQKFVEWEMRTGTPTWKLTQASKQYEINRKANHQKTYIKATENNKILNEILKAYKERYDRHFRKCRGELRVYKLISRLTIGLGGADIREIGFTLHRHGFPYVPSSALKGAARASAELIEKASQEDIQEVFGWTPDPKQGLEDACIGRAFFWDAIPLPGQRLLELDVMNPHFPTYYRTEGRKPPAEWDSPIPLYFLAVPAGTEFLFAIEADKAVQAKALRWLDLALTQLGIGAKTTLGYGLWTRIM